MLAMQRGQRASQCSTVIIAGKFLEIWEKRRRRNDTAFHKNKYILKKLTA